jgi:transcriptional repressor NrdR
MRCPHCGFMEDKVVDSRPSQDGRAIRRRRQCLKCNERFTTYEYVEQSNMTVIKADGRREPFDKNKILSGLKLACNKRPVSTKQMEAIVEAIEAHLSAEGNSEVKAKQIGELVVEKLRAVDDIAFVRFASVYRQFQDKQEFFEELKKLMDQ